MTGSRINQTPRGTTWATTAVLVGCTFLQRFCIPLGTLKLPLVIPIALCVFFILGLQRQLLVSKSSLLKYLLFFASVTCTTCLAIVTPPEGTAITITSVLLLAVLYAFLVVRVRLAPTVAETLAIFRNIMIIIAVCGCLQFATQFVGLRIFSFTSFVPDSLLLEKSYATISPLRYGATVFKSNGLFLLEPSFFSQFVALALVVEFLHFHNRLRMATLSLALCVAFSGTGLLVLGCAVVVAISMDRRNFHRAAQVALIAGFVAVVFAVLAPAEYVQVFVGRATEINSTQSSAFMRFVAPHLATMQLCANPRIVLGFGPGSSERFSFFEVNTAFNALNKLLIEYGLPGLLLCLRLLLSVLYRTDLRVVSIAGLFLYIIGGGYLLNPSIVFLLAALFAWSRHALKT
jgi:hypothetical protein